MLVKVVPTSVVLLLRFRKEVHVCTTGGRPLGDDEDFITNPPRSLLGETYIQGRVTRVRETVNGDTGVEGNRVPPETTRHKGGGKSRQVQFPI